VRSARELRAKPEPRAKPEKTRKTKNIIEVRNIYNDLGPHRSCGLSVWMALTGCDLTSSTKSRLKRAAYNAWMKCSETLTHAMVQVVEQPKLEQSTTLELLSAQLKCFESFFINNYSDGADTINEQREHIFCHRNQNPEMMPSTQDALLQHCERALYQAGIWASVH